MFFLGTHRPQWLSRSTVPLFVSAVTLRRRKSPWPRATCEWALDSGGFSELSLHGRWTVGAAQYADEVQRWSREVGAPAWVAIQDWMCEPYMLAKTGKTIREHQELTIASLVELRRLAPGIRWAPVLQGWEVSDYVEHMAMYLAAGFDLRDEPIVGVGSVCRRQGTSEASVIMRTLAALGIRIHAFGIKTLGLRLYGDKLSSSDSMAWSFAARRQNIRLPGCQGHKTCANCFAFAMAWVEKLQLVPSAPPPATPMLHAAQLAFSW